MATKKKTAPKGKKPKKRKQVRKRDYKKEYARRVARAKALGYSRSVARGHPRRGEGEVGRAELRQMRQAIRILSPGQQRIKLGAAHPKSRPERQRLRERVAELAGLTTEVPDSTEGTRRGTDAERFVEKFLELGLGTAHQALTLYFSP